MMNDGLAIVLMGSAYMVGIAIGCWAMLGSVSRSRLRALRAEAKVKDLELELKYEAGFDWPHPEDRVARREQRGKA